MYAVDTFRRRTRSLLPWRGKNGRTSISSDTIVALNEISHGAPLASQGSRRGVDVRLLQFPAFEIE